VEATPVDIRGWLTNLGLEQYEVAFRRNGVNAEILRHLTAEDFKELGISAVGHRRQLQVAIAALRPGETPSEPPSQASPGPPVHPADGFGPAAC
jgi:hypothetical protein